MTSDETKEVEAAVENYRALRELWKGMTDEFESLHAAYHSAYSEMANAENQLYILVRKLAGVIH